MSVADVVRDPSATLSQPTRRELLAFLARVCETISPEALASEGIETLSLDSWLRQGWRA